MDLVARERSHQRMLILLPLVMAGVVVETVSLEALPSRAEGEEEEGAKEGLVGAVEKMEVREALAIEEEDLDVARRRMEGTQGVVEVEVLEDGVVEDKTRKMEKAVMRMVSQGEGLAGEGALTGTVETRRTGVGLEGVVEAGEVGLEVAGIKMAMRTKTHLRGLEGVVEAGEVGLEVAGIKMAMRTKTHLVDVAGEGDEEALEGEETMVTKGKVLEGFVMKETVSPSVSCIDVLYIEAMVVEFKIAKTFSS